MVNYKFHFPSKRWPKVLLIIASLLTVAIIGTAFLVARNYYQNLKPASASQTAQLVTIPLGSSVSQIADTLHKAGVIRSAWAFEWYVRNSDARSQLKAGTYSFRPSQSVQEIVGILTQGKIDTSLFTILPGKRLDEIRQDMINGGFAPSEVESALSPALYKNHPALVDKPATANLEGYLYPESFQRTADTKAETIVRASLNEMQKYLTPEVRAGMVKQGLTVHQGVILASIIEQEVSDKNPEDRPKVAQVFLKRLRQNMALESDATADYGAILAGQPPTPGFDSPYNTYKHRGLTPGPISNVSASSLRAVASPASTDYLYFVSGDNDINYFSHTLAEHEAAAAQYCHKKCGR